MKEFIELAEIITKMQGDLSWQWRENLKVRGKQCNYKIKKKIYIENNLTIFN